MNTFPRLLGLAFKRPSAHVRTFQLGAVSEANNHNTANRQVKIMNKMLFGRNNKSKKNWYNSEPSFNQFTSVKSISNPMGVQKHTSRRVVVLNKLFMKNITDLMATGEISEEILGRGIEVSRVKVAPDFQIVNVYWLAKGSEDDEAIDAILRQCAGKLRHELSQLRIMGEVPRINFIKDIEYSKYVQVERLLKSADLGDDNAEIECHQAPLQSSEDMPDEIYNTRIPQMRHDVLGLNHSLILNKIQEKLKVTKVAWEDYESKSMPSSVEPVDNSSATAGLPNNLKSPQLQNFEREERFAKFLQKQRLKKSAQRNGRLRDHYIAEEANLYMDDDHMDADEPDTFDEEFYKRSYSREAD